MQEKNKGSTTIEISLIIPFILGVLYLYILLFLTLLQSTQYSKVMIEELYQIQEGEETDNESNLGVKSAAGEKLSIFKKEEGILLEIDLEYHRKRDTAVENIRRWKFATDTIHTGTDESLHGIDGDE